MPITNPAQSAGEVQRAIAPGDDVRVEVDEGPVAPNGLVLKFLAAGRGRIVTCVQYEDERGLAGWWDVRGVDDAAAECAVDACAVEVQDSSEGTVVLIRGGRHGLLLRHRERGVTAREPYLVLRVETPMQ